MRKVLSLAVIALLAAALYACVPAGAPKAISLPSAAQAADNTFEFAQATEEQKNSVPPPETQTTEQTNAPVTTERAAATKKPAAATTATATKTTTRAAATATSTSTSDPAATTPKPAEETTTTGITNTRPVTTTGLPAGSVMKDILPYNGASVKRQGPGTISNIIPMECITEKAVYNPGDEQIVISVTGNTGLNRNFELQKWDGSQWREYDAWAQWVHNSGYYRAEGLTVLSVSLEGYAPRTDGLYRILFWNSGGIETTGYNSAVFEINRTGEATYTKQQLKEMFYLFWPS